MLLSMKDVAKFAAPASGFWSTLRRRFIEMAIDANFHRKAVQIELVLHPAQPPIPDNMVRAAAVPVHFLEEVFASWLPGSGFGSGEIDF